jgi:dihydrofolate reductase
MKNFKFDMILAVDEENWIGRANSLAWKISSDMKYFKKITTETQDLAKMNAVVMWKNTWFSIPEKFRPLPDRINCILSNNLKQDDIWSKIDDFVLYFNSFEHCLSELEWKENVENIFVIWWATLYNSVINNEFLDRIYLTKVKWNFNCDVHFAWIPENFVVESYTDWQEENGVEFSFWVYKKSKVVVSRGE